MIFSLKFIQKQDIIQIVTFIVIQYINMHKIVDKEVAETILGRLLVELTLDYYINPLEMEEMSQKRTFLNTTVGKKVLMSATGLMLFGFLTSHLVGNFLLLDAIGGRDAFNDYAHWLVSHPAIIPMEIGLFAIFIIHIVSAVKVSLASKAARPEGYAVRNTMGKSTFFSRSMLQTGSIIFIFLVLHLTTFKFGTEHKVSQINENVSKTTELSVVEGEIKVDTTTIDTAVIESKRDLYQTVVENFAKKWYSLVYIFCMIVMGFHLAHGFQSAFQTLGLNHPKYNCCIKGISNFLAICFALGYSVFPIYFGFINPIGG